MAEIKIDQETLALLVRDAVSQAMKPYIDELNKINIEIARRDPSLCPQNCACKKRMETMAETTTRNSESTKSAHHRIDGIFKTAAIVAGAVSGVVGILIAGMNFLINAAQAAAKLKGG